jgi:hypothetical protein
MKSKKSTGLDNISNEMLKSGQSFLIPCLHKLFNNCFAMGYYYPANWTHGHTLDNIIKMVSNAVF